MVGFWREKRRKNLTISGRKGYVALYSITRNVHLQKAVPSGLRKWRHRCYSKSVDGMNGAQDKKQKLT